MDIDAFRAQFNPVFSAYLHERLADMRARVHDPFLYDMIAQAVRIAEHGGKRARPFFAYTMYKECGGKDDVLAMRLAVGVELFHIFCLIHDDITDRGLLRHGVATIHEYAAKSMNDHERHGDLLHIAESHAMLVGDLVYAWAYERIAGMRSAGDDVHLRALAVFVDALQDVIAGQMMDIDFTTRTDVTREDILKKMEFKTARYTFVHPLMLGATLAGAGSDVMDFCKAFGTSAGIAFQIQDDILDITGEEEKMGKRPMGDIREGQHTLLTDFVFHNASLADQEIFLRVFGHADASQEGIDDAKRMLYTCGALAHAEREADVWFERAEALLPTAPLSAEAQHMFSLLLTRLRHRAA